jgi:hypothetical protein
MTSCENVEPAGLCVQTKVLVSLGEEAVESIQVLLSLREVDPDLFSSDLVPDYPHATTMSY